jgi:NAD(P)-dependent dehydrogenase (short-subunit alcohol dehydrogenase family)
MAAQTTATSPSSQKVVLVTGCTRGMGKKLFEYFVADSRYRMVIGVSRPSDKLEKMKRSFASPKCQIIGLDITDATAVEQLAQQLKQSNCIPNLLINNAAILGPVKPFEEITPHEFDLTLRTNLNGAFYFMKYFIPLMKEQHLQQQSYTIINMASGWGTKFYEKNFSAYCTSKCALEGLTQAAAEDLKSFKNITVVAVAPGIVETDMLHEAASSGVQAKNVVSLDNWIKTFPDMILNVNKQQSGQQLDWAAPTPRAG